VVNDQVQPAGVEQGRPQDIADPRSCMNEICVLHGTVAHCCLEDRRCVSNACRAHAMAAEFGVEGRRVARELPSKRQQRLIALRGWSPERWQRMSFARSTRVSWLTLTSSAMSAFRAAAFRCRGTR
jgi:hypothetical protein